MQFQQWDLNGGETEATNIPDKWNTWRLFSAGEGYYYIISEVGDGASYALDVDENSNLQIYEFNGNDNQKFCFTKNSDGSYKIRTKISGDTSAIEVSNASKEFGANIQQWEINGESCQDWTLEKTKNSGTEMDTHLYYIFRNVNSKLVMDIINGEMKDNSNVQQWEANGNPCQKWNLETERPETILGDVNDDGIFNTADITTLQRWLLHDGTKLNHWQSADLNYDEIINIYDLVLLKKALLAKS